MKFESDPTTDATTYLHKLLAIAQQNRWEASSRCIEVAISEIENRTF